MEYESAAKIPGTIRRTDQSAQNTPIRIVAARTVPHRDKNAEQADKTGNDEGGNRDVITARSQSRLYAAEAEGNALHKQCRQNGLAPHVIECRSRLFSQIRIFHIHTKLLFHLIYTRNEKRSFETPLL